MTATATRPQRPRLIVPDIARGLTLAGIAVANATGFWSTTTEGAAAPFGGVVGDSVLDKVAVVAGTILVHNRGVTMFAFLLGYGMAMLWSSLERRHYPPGPATRVLLRRYGMLALFGLIHTVVLFYGDIMLFYGLAGMLLVPVLRARDTTLLWIAGGLGLLALILGPVLFVVGLMGSPAPANQTYLSQVGWGLITVAAMPLQFFVEAIIFLPLMIAGVLAGRHRILSAPDKHRRLLLVVALVGAACATVAGVLNGLAALDAIAMSSSTAQAINQDLGLLTGPGIIAAIALVCAPQQRRIDEAAAQGVQYQPPLGYRMLAALGARSMSGYVAQSVLFSIFVAPYGLGWTAGDGAWDLSLAGLAVWGVTVVGAWAYGARPGPLEVLHRRLSYGSQGLAADYRQRGSAPAVAGGAVHPQPGPGGGADNLLRGPHSQPGAGGVGPQVPRLHVWPPADHHPDA